MTKTHWSTALKAENTLLKGQLEAALLALRQIPQSRLLKNLRFPFADDDAHLAYQQCAQEVERMGRAEVERINDMGPY